MTSLRFVSQPTFGDVVRVGFDRAFRSLGAQALHGFGWGVAAFGVLFGIPADIWLPPALLAVLFGTGLLSLVFQWWIYGRHPERLVETVTTDESGLMIEAPDSQLRHAWRMYRDAEESKDAFVLFAVRTMPQVFGKRGVSDAALEEFRGFLRGAGLLRERRTAVRGIAGFLLGFCIALGLPFVAGFVRIG
jgi:YcxB-like protein